MKKILSINDPSTETASDNASAAHPVQCKLTVGAANDTYEQEADAVADKVMRMPGHDFVQRKCAHCEEEEKKQVQRKPSMGNISTTPQTKGEDNGSVSNSVNKRISSSQGSGSSMDTSTESFMSNRFEKDFSQVKIHTDSEAIQMSRELNAKAFTVDNDIYFNEGQYHPGSDSGKHLLAHELVHTIQQGNKGSVVQREENNVPEQDDKTPDEKDRCEGWERDLQSLTIDAARHHFRTKHGETIQVEKLDCVSGTSVKLKVCELTLTDGRQVSVHYNPERNIILVQHEVGGVLKNCRYSYTCTESGSVVYTEISCNE